MVTVALTVVAERWTRRTALTAITRLTWEQPSGFAGLAGAGRFLVWFWGLLCGCCMLRNWTMIALDAIFDRADHFLNSGLVARVLGEG